MNHLYLYYHPRFYILVIASSFEEAYFLIDNKYKTTDDGYLIPFQTGVDLLQELGVRVADAKRIVRVLAINNKED